MAMSPSRERCPSAQLPQRDAVILCLMMLQSIDINMEHAVHNLTPDSPNKEGNVMSSGVMTVALPSAQLLEQCGEKQSKEAKKLGQPAVAKHTKLARGRASARYDGTAHALSKASTLACQVASPWDMSYGPSAPMQTSYRAASGLKKFAVT